MLFGVVHAKIKISAHCWQLIYNDHLFIIYWTLSTTLLAACLILPFATFWLWHVLGFD